MSSSDFGVVVPLPHRLSLQAREAEDRLILAYKRMLHNSSIDLLISMGNISFQSLKYSFLSSNESFQYQGT